MTRRYVSADVIRRCVLGVAILLVIACLDPAGTSPSLTAGTSWANRTENARPGSLGWDADLYSTTDSRVGGYVSPFTVAAGDTLRLFVTALSAAVTTTIYRLGWYDGLGARLVARHPERPVARQRPCSLPVPGPSLCEWVETDRFMVGPEWVPGVYLAKFADDAGQAGAVPFVVRSPRHTPFVVILPFATYQAYNDWNGTSLYKGLDSIGHPSYAQRAFKVSFARPWAHGTIQTHFLGLDYLLVRWLEENSYDVS